LFTEPRKDKGEDIHTDTQTEEELMKYNIELGSGAMIYIPSFI
jgi:hypothetical protein